MIDEGDKNGQKDSMGFLSYAGVFDREVKELEKLLERIFPGGAALVAAFFAPDAVVNTDWFSDSDSASLYDVETGESTTITGTNELAFLTLVATLHESRAQYAKENIDFAWRALVGLSRSLQDLNAQFDSFDKDEMPLLEITVLRSALAAAGAKGAGVKHASTRALKQWAVESSHTMRGSDRELSRALANRLPAEFVGVSEDPGRLIYDALRAARKSSS